MRKIQKIIIVCIVCIISLSDIAIPIVYANVLYDGNSVQPKAFDEPKFQPITQQTKTTRTSSHHDASPTVLGLADMAFTNDSAQQRLPIKVQKLEKHDFNADEEVTVIVSNPEGEAIQTEVLDDDGQEVAVLIKQIDTATSSELFISPTNQFKPGKYTVVVTDADGKQTKQDFTWGVLAFNADKAVYFPKEKAFLSMAVLDDKGAMVCDADVRLEIRNPKSEIQNLSTEEGTIVVNKECNFTEFTLKPDYEATYDVGDAGTYEVKLKATTEKGTYSITDAFEVKEETDFVIKRTSATRLYPPIEYPMNIEITANRDFSGVITETVPESFTITPSDSSNSYDDMNTLYLQGIDPAVKLEKKVLSGSDSLLEMPFNGSYTISQGFGFELTDLPLKAFYSDHGLAGHDGIDFALPTGTPLFAVDEGMVLEAGDGDYGITVIIQHRWGRSYYGHLSKTTLTKGTQITKGSHLGYSGNTGESTGPHLHFGIKPNTPDTNNGYAGKIDPLPFLPKTEKASAGLSFNLEQQTAVLAASTAAEVSLDATDSVDEAITPTPILSQTPLEELDLPLEITASTSATDTASEGAKKDFIVTDKQIEEEVKNSENPVHERVKVIQWNVSIKKGEKMTLSYMYKAPLVSPQFYTIGSLKFFEEDSENATFEEGRKWQIAADAIGVGWYNYDWVYRKQITINDAQVPATQSNFPVLVNLTTDAALASHAQTDADDILFTDSTGKTKLSHEIETYTSGTGGLIAWVKVPSLAGSANTDIYIYYGNASTTNQQDITNTWDNNHRGVWHLKEDPSGTAPQMVDSTSNNNDGTTGGAMTTGDQVSGKIDGSLDFDNVNDSIDMGDQAELDYNGTAITVSAWINNNALPPALGDVEGIVSKDVYTSDTNNGGYVLALRDISGTKSVSFNVFNSSGTNVQGVANFAYTTTSAWHHVVGTYDGSTISLYLDGILVDTTAYAGGIKAITQSFSIGKEAGANFFPGIIDEVKMSDTNRSANWIATEYNNQNSPATFYTLGGVETKAFAASPAQLMRHGKFFDSTQIEQPFIF